MKVLWAKGTLSVAQVRRELGDASAYTTIMTLLGRLVQKRAVAVDKSREPFLYQPILQQQEVVANRLRDFLSNVFDGCADSLIMGLVRSEALSPEALEALAQQLAAAKPAPDAASKASDATSDAVPEKAQPADQLGNNQGANAGSKEPA